MVPVGYRFAPTDEEICCEYLLKKVRGLPLPSDGVVEMDIYSREPWFLLNKKDGYYFVRREKKHISGKGKTPKRSLGITGTPAPSSSSSADSDYGGWWKSSTGDKPIACDHGRLVGYKKTLNFFCYINKNRNSKESIKSNWIMHEYRLPSQTFQEWVLCHIKNYAKEAKPAKIQLHEKEGCLCIHSNVHVPVENGSMETLNDGPESSSHLEPHYEQIGHDCHDKHSIQEEHLPPLLEEYAECGREGGSNIDAQQYSTNGLQSSGHLLESNSQLMEFLFDQEYAEFGLHNGCMEAQQNTNGLHRSDSESKFEQFLKELLNPMEEAQMTLSGGEEANAEQ